MRLLAVAGVLSSSLACTTLPTAPLVRADDRDTVIETPPRPAVQAATAQRVHPSATELPENILRFYVYFSHPMAEGQFIQHVRLTHVESGTDLTGVFFDNIHELWSRDRRRITLLVDPGRVKTGLRAHRMRGRAFEAGQTYALRILRTWPTIDGRTLDDDLVKVFRATSEDRRPVDPKRWRVSSPLVGTRSPLQVDFLRSVDHVSLAHFTKVLGARGKPLRGRWRLDDDGQTAEWIPAHPWTASQRGHRLVVHGRFEDAAGNNLNAAFDHALGALGGRGEDREVALRFDVRSSDGPAARQAPPDHRATSPAAAASSPAAHISRPVRCSGLRPSGSGTTEPSPIRTIPARAPDESLAA